MIDVPVNLAIKFRVPLRADQPDESRNPPIAALSPGAPFRVVEQRNLSDDDLLLPLSVACLRLIRRHGN